MQDIPTLISPEQREVMLSDWHRHPLTRSLVTFLTLRMNELADRAEGHRREPEMASRYLEQRAAIRWAQEMITTGLFFPNSTINNTNPNLK